MLRDCQRASDNWVPLDSLHLLPGASLPHGRAGCYSRPCGRSPSRLQRLGPAVTPPGAGRRARLRAQAAGPLALGCASARVPRGRSLRAATPRPDRGISQSAATSRESGHPAPQSLEACGGGGAGSGEAAQAQKRLSRVPREASVFPLGRPAPGRRPPGSPAGLIRGQPRRP
jgi:hypothetical protein